MPSVSCSRRQFLKASALLLARSAFPSLASAQQAGDISDLETAPVSVPWRSVIHLSISDPELKKHVEGFLTFFERHSFPYDEMDSFTQVVTRKTLSGQDILQRIKDILQLQSSIGLDAAKIAHSYPKFQHTDIAKNKLTIAQHDMPFDGSTTSGSLTMFVGNESGSVVLPIAIGIGKQYLQGAKYLGVDGEHYPVSVDGVVVHELAHYALAQKGEAQPLSVEGIVTAAMGAVQRDSRTSDVEFVLNGNGGYVTLYDKLRPREPALQPRTVNLSGPSKG